MCISGRTPPGTVTRDMCNAAYLYSILAPIGCIYVTVLCASTHMSRVGLVPIRLPVGVHAVVLRLVIHGYAVREQLRLFGSSLYQVMGVQTAAASCHQMPKETMCHSTGHGDGQLGISA